MLRDNESGLDQEAEWVETHKGMYQCVYCGNVYVEQPVRGCCKEVHFNIIGEDDVSI